jgi:hypothetical protein
MKERIYYERDEKNRPIVTVCLLQINGAFARGLAVCSPQDNPDKKVGRKIARQRAGYAVKTRSNNCLMNSQKALAAIHGASTAGKFNWCKSAYNPPLTQFETHLIFGERP